MQNNRWRSNKFRRNVVVRTQSETGFCWKKHIQRYQCSPNHFEELDNPQKLKYLQTRFCRFRIDRSVTDLWAWALSLGRSKGSKYGGENKAANMNYVAMSGCIPMVTLALFSHFRHSSNPHTTSIPRLEPRQWRCGCSTEQDSPTGRSTRGQ